MTVGDRGTLTPAAGHPSPKTSSKKRPSRLVGPEPDAFPPRMTFFLLSLIISCHDHIVVNFMTHDADSGKTVRGQNGADPGLGVSEDFTGDPERAEQPRASSRAADKKKTGPKRRNPIGIPPEPRAVPDFPGGRPIRSPATSRPPKRDSTPEPTRAFAPIPF